MPSKPEVHAKYMREVWYPKNKDKHIRLVAKNKEHCVKNNKILINSIKSVPCKDCGQSFPPCVMDFDHVVGNKVRDVSNGVGIGWSKKKILAEVAKCEVVCANCHRIRTFASDRS